ncbi:MAG: hypothetical protein ABR600_10940 [Actinomycetota bacterium]
MVAVLGTVASIGAVLVVVGVAWDARLRWRRLGRASSSGSGFSLSFSDRMRLTEMRRGLHGGAWRRDHRLQAFLLVALGLGILVPSVILLAGWIWRPLGLVWAGILLAVAAARAALAVHRAR